MRTFLLLFVLLASPVHAEVNAYLNKYSISTQETVRLTIESTQQGQPQRPDLSVLNQDFDLLGIKQMTISSLQAGSRQATTRWQVLLRPKHAGQIKIPALSVNGEQADPLLIEVTGLLPKEITNQSTPTVDGEPLFITTSIDHTEAYEGSQLIYRVKFFHKEPLNKNAVLSDPFLNQALILPIEEIKKSEIKIKGQAYFLEERRYAIFPDEPGTHFIEPPLFSGTSASDQYFETQGNEIEIAVIPRANTNSRGYWLPLSTLQLEESIDQPAVLAPGSSLIRKLTLTAHGLPAARLPSLSILKNELADLELLQTDLEESFDERGLVSRRIETVKVTMKERGEVTLPPIDIHWWDTYEDQSKIASIPPLILHVNSPTHSTSPLVPAKKAVSFESTSAPESPTSDIQSTTPTQQPPSQQIPLIVFLATVSIISSLGWLYTYNGLRKMRVKTQKKREALTERQNEKKIHAHSLAEKNTFQALAMACQQDNVDISKLRLIEWAQHFWPDTLIQTLEDISPLTRNKTFDFLIIDMEQHLYSNEKSLWQGDLLLQAIEKLRLRRNKGKI
ncbi:BatD family protein [Neptunomonas antarctica]|uniref:Oxygen tolerance n=1 Tax=Neptunomonas antarctica TaxID=619304 RepID=A0A1N7KG20_9GAMM|nr:BatD family protein [Neptunomonas antarctica]SIS60430.1 Oxygen tolerance [Neptunomonas antarctica]